METNKKSLNIYGRKSKLRFMFIASVSIIPIGFLLIYFINLWVIGLPLIIGGLMTIYPNYKKLFLNDPLLLIDEHGITDNMNFPSVGFTAWKDIEKADIQDVYGYNNLCLYLKNPHEKIKQAFFLKRFFMKSNQKNIGTYIFFRTNIFPISSEKILEIVNQMIDLNKAK